MPFLGIPDDVSMQYLQYMFIYYQDAGVALLVLGPPPPQPGHDVTCQFIKMDNFKAQAARVATPTLSVLKSHFNPACKTVVRQK